jgi:hypothetical protein
MCKGVFNDMTGVISNSNEDLERPDRALGAARLWLDPRINMHVSEVIFLFLFILFNLSIPIF